MNAAIAVEDVVRVLRRRYGKERLIGRSQRLWAFGDALSCSINYSKLLQGHHYFFGLSREVTDSDFSYPKNKLGAFVLLICARPDQVLALPRSLVLEMLEGVLTRRLDVFCEGETYILQTTQHPKLDVSQYLNCYPSIEPIKPAADQDEPEARFVERDHVRYQSALIDIGRAEGCSVWIPPNDRGLSFRGRSFSDRTIGRLPNLGIDENTRRIVQNIDVLWLYRNTVLKAFEIEASTSIYSGLLRLNDLALAQPNNRIHLYLAASRQRRLRVLSQLLRPSFQSLITNCEFLAFEAIEEASQKLLAIPLDQEVKVTGLIKGERFQIPDSYVYPPGL